ncbi:MAG TPA: tail fiber protein [Dissulfurispiraceae bacterium]|nr:tail fiber protein [Dissulfurispiraceae bacterium]
MGNPDELNLAKKNGERFQINSPYLSLSEYDSSYLAYSGLEIQGDDWIHKFKAIKATGASPTIVRLSSPLSGTSRTQTYLINVNEEKPPAPFSVYRAFYHGHGEPIDDSFMLGEVTLFPFILPVQGFKLCNGAPMSISENKDLYNLLLFLSYDDVKWDSTTAFKLPDLTQKFPLAGLTYQICTSGPFPQNPVRSPDELAYYPASRYADQFLSEIVLAKNVGEQESQWLTPCDGRIMLINKNTALFTLLGDHFGGDMRITFALPDLSAAESIVAGTKYYMVTQGRYPLTYY